MQDLYKQDGVNISAGDAFSKYAKDLFQQTYNKSGFVKVYDLSRGNFRGPRGFRYKNVPGDYIETGGMDGIGTKVVIIDAAGNFTDAASNLLAMTAMDITRWGGLPLVFLNIYDTRSLGEIGSEKFEASKEIIWGLWKDAMQYGFVVLGGETAELGMCVGSENPDAKVMFNWGGCMLGIYHPKKMILGDTLEPGQVIIVLADDFRSNGISSVRKAFSIKYGPEWWKNPEAMADILAAASPSITYDRLLNYANGWYNDPEEIFKPWIQMHLISHLTGGAFESKLAKDLLEPQGLSAELTDLFDPPEIMQKCAEWRGMSPEECYRTWNGGQGALVVVNREDANDFLKLAEKYKIAAKIAGKVLKKQNNFTIAINSKFDGGGIVCF